MFIKKLYLHLKNFILTGTRLLNLYPDIFHIKNDIKNITNSIDNITNNIDNVTNVISSIDNHVNGMSYNISNTYNAFYEKIESIINNENNYYSDFNNRTNDINKSLSYINAHIEGLNKDIIQGRKCIEWKCDNYIGNYYAQQYVDNHLDYYEELCSFFLLKKSDFEFIRLGRDNDGGYILVNDLNGGVAYSLGISDDISFDKDLLKFGYEVYMYDNSIDNLPEINHKFHFFKYGIGHGNNLYSLNDIVKINNHNNIDNMILKMDIEGYEYETLYYADDDILKKFSQIVIEFHDIISFTNTLIFPVLKKINKYFQCVHIHGQDVSPIVKVGENRILSNYIEVTYVNKLKYQFSTEKCKLPLPIDMPTYKDRREIYLGDWSYY